MTESRSGMTRRQSLVRESTRRGQLAVVGACRQLIRGEHPSRDIVMALGGPGASKFFDGEPHRDTYWLRVWGTRGLLWAWNDSALPELRSAMRDDAWRVREMAWKVVARNLLGDFTAEAGAARDDPVVRVRVAAERAVTRLTSCSA